MKTVFSGIQPTGNIHIGNYLGAIKNWIKLQSKHQCIFCIVDYHALTIPFEPKEMQSRILTTAIDLLAAGIDPKKSILFVQSAIPQHTELAWILNTITPMSELKRMTQFKDKSKQFNKNINVGLFDYPVLQAADILLYQANFVPVGTDQIQHVELTRDIARKFNQKFGNYFNEPEPILTETPKIMSLKDPIKKMSKSLGPDHYIALSDQPETIREKIKKAVTDSGDEKNLSSGVKNLFELLKLFGNKKDYIKMSDILTSGNIKYSELKDILADSISTNFSDFRKKRAKLEKNKKDVINILAKGSRKAQKIAVQNMIKVRKLIGLN